MHVDGAECVKKTKEKLSVRRVFRLLQSVIPSPSQIRFQKRKVLKSETLIFEVGGRGGLWALKALKKCTKSSEGCCVRVFSGFISVEAV